MDFRLTQEQETLRAAVVDFARKDLNEDLISRDRDGDFSIVAWQKCAEFGLLGLPIPEEYGGAGADILTTMLALEGLGYGCADNGLIFSLNAQLWAVETPIARFGNEAQKERYLPELCNGTMIGAHAMSEPEAGSDAFALTTTARETSTGYVLTGSKTFVTNAPHADLFLVFATTNRERGFAALCAFLVHRDTPGLSVGSELSKMGLRTSPMSELFFDECEVARDQVLATPGAGMTIFNSAMRLERSCILASCIGTMQRQLDRSVTYAKERKQYGQPIGSFQAVSQKIVDMKLRLETARLLLYHVGWLTSEGKSPTLEAALTKLHISESFLQSSLDAVQIHGGYGYMTEYELERDVRDALGSRLYSGTSEIQRNIVAKSLGL
ncbi:MAG TPA: acyl-CoA dehydrogenase family protein [Gaiellaceae bacterium]|jgi:alkylation response protein AidB-like acyl-CoA dehydrogenase